MSQFFLKGERISLFRNTTGKNMKKWNSCYTYFLFLKMIFRKSVIGFSAESVLNFFAPLASFSWDSKEDRSWCSTRACFQKPMVYKDIVAQYNIFVIWPIWNPVKWSHHQSITWTFKSTKIIIGLDIWYAHIHAYLFSRIDFLNATQMFGIFSY